MYKLPADFDAQFFVGRNLEQICFNQNQIALHFDDDLSIVIESAFSHEEPQSPSDGQVVEVPVSDSDLMRLLGCSVSEASGDGDGTLILVFENGHVLKCFDTSDQYESYQIEHHGNVIIV
jgi:Family of unknown function (DUF6188)